ncbi:MAG: hypothetical protein ACI4XH_06380 [Acutalibacteraceae bacterium]
MNIHKADVNKFIVELSPLDMNELDITYEEMDYADIETRRVIWTILEKVRESTGCDVDPSGSLIIEAAADADGGCILCFTVPETKRRSSPRRELCINKNNCGIVYEFECVNDLLDMIKTVGKDNLPKANRLYKSKKHFRLVLGRSPGSAEKKAIEEYATFVGRDVFTVAQTAEHWEPAGKI